MADSPVLHATSKQPRLRAPLPMNPGNGPVSDRPADSPSVQPAVATAAAGAGWGAPAASPAVPAQPVTSPAASDNRSIDEKWDAAVAAFAGNHS